MQILTYARHLWPLSSEGSILCYTYCDTGHPFIMVISEDQWHSHLLPSVWQWSCHYLFLRHRSFAGGIRTPNLPLAGRTLQPTVPPPRLKYKLGTYENVIYIYINYKILDFFSCPCILNYHEMPMVILNYYYQYRRDVRWCPVPVIATPLVCKRSFHWI